MRTLILFIATLIVTLLATHNPNRQDIKKNEQKADTLFSSKKSTCSEISLKKSRSKFATFYSFYVL
jgi:hypothetical protein